MAKKMSTCKLNIFNCPKIQPNPKKKKMVKENNIINIVTISENNIINIVTISSEIKENKSNYKNVKIEKKKKRRRRRIIEKLILEKADAMVIASNKYASSSKRNKLSLNWKKIKKLPLLNNNDVQEEQ